MHIRTFTVGILAYIAATLSLLFWQLALFVPFTISLLVAIGLNTIYGSMNEYVHVWSNLEKEVSSKELEGYRKLRAYSQLIFLASLVIFTIFVLVDDTRDKWNNDNEVSEALLISGVTTASLYALSAVGNILAVCDKNIFERKDDILKNKTLLMRSRRTLSINAVYQIVISAFSISLILHLEDIPNPNMNDSNLRHLATSLLFVDTIFNFLHYRYFTYDFDEAKKYDNILTDEMVLSHVCSAVGKFIIYIVIWRRLHLEKCIENMQFYGSDWVWLIGSACFLLVSVLLVLVKHKTIQWYHSTLTIVGSLVAIIFFITAVHFHRRKLEIRLCNYNTNSTS